MIAIAWKRSGGLMGRTLQAQGEVDLQPGDLERALTRAGRKPQPKARDLLTDVLVVEGKEYPVDIERIKGPLKKELDRMEAELRPIPLRRGGGPGR